MSYCVNCGVELDPALEVCPLCHTPVVNPGQIKPVDKKPPFPMEKGQVEEVKRKDLGVLLTSVLVAVSVTCGLLNLLVFQSSAWSLLVIGVCIVLWVFCVPAVIYTRLNVYGALLLDGLSIVLYLYLITFMTGSEGWYWGLALPITVYVIALAELLALCVRKIPRSMLVNGILFFSSIGILCVGIELLIRRFLEERLWLTWSAVVLTVCVILVIMLVTLLSRRRLRNAVRRRLHF